MKPHTGPPIKVEGRTPHHQGQPSTDNTNGYHTANYEVHGNAWVRQLRARRAASQRLPVLDCGRSDPWHYERPTTANCSTALNSSASDYEIAVAHLLEHGLLPAPNQDGLRAMWRRGGSSRQAADVIAHAWGMVA